jgi:hypothetical protein
MEAFGANRTYAEKVLEHLYDYLLRIDEVRGTGAAVLAAETMNLSRTNHGFRELGMPLQRTATAN